MENEEGATVKQKMNTRAVCPRVWNGNDCQCEPLCHCGKGEHDSIHDASKVKDLDGVHKFNPMTSVILSLPTSDTPRTDKWIERYNLMRGTGLEAFPMDLEYELKAKAAIISDMGKRFDKLGDDLAAWRDRVAVVDKQLDAMSEELRDMTSERDALKATCEDYRKQACTPDNCRRVDQAENQKSCNWCEDEDDNWATSCRHMFTFDDGGPSENHFKVCPFCSGKIQEIKFVEEL